MSCRADAAAPLRRRGCDVLGCLDYYERFLGPQQPPAALPPREDGPAKPEGCSAEDVQRWLETFGEMEDP